jgi:RimJ/RimL family protein N-acetyltransferase
MNLYAYKNFYDGNSMLNPKDTKIHFEKLASKHVNIVFDWLTQDFIMEFWDNSQPHQNDILNFVEGRKTPSPYANGQYVYWISRYGDEPFAMLMTIQETDQSDIALEKIKILSKTGNTYGIDYMIGNRDFFGKGFGAKVLNDFIEYFRTNVDREADTFLIDPDCNNPKAKHVYQKAGFKHICDFIMEGNCSGAGRLHYLLLLKVLKNNRHIISSCFNS